jgi:hypothetical protein
VVAKNVFIRIMVGKTPSGHYVIPTNITSWENVQRPPNDSRQKYWLEYLAILDMNIGWKLLAIFD